MAKQIGFSRVFPSYHPEKGKPTYFVEKFLNSFGIDFVENTYYEWLEENNPKRTAKEINDFFHSLNFAITDEKYHTIRSGDKRKFGDIFQPYVWVDKPYHSGQIKFAPETTILKIWEYKSSPIGMYMVNSCLIVNQQNVIDNIANNDGLSRIQFDNWFAPNGKKSKPFSGQIICWNKNAKYLKSDI